MIERGSGRTSGLTDWRLMDVLSMWTCLQDQDTTGHWKQVAGWRKVCDLALAHLSRLQEYRRGLAEAWPPETNAAARAYIGELDQLIEKVQRTHDAAAGNYDALAAATRALSSTRADLKPIYEEYAAKLQQKRAYEAVVADPKAVAGSRLPEQPPVTDADLEQLNVRARSLMTGLSGELQQAQVMLRQPPSPVRPVRDPASPDAYRDGTSSAPIIPPIVPVPVAASGSSKPATQLASTPQPVTTPIALASGSVIGAGPVLGGATSGLAPTPTHLVPPNLTTPTQPSASGPGIGLSSPALPPFTGPQGRSGATRPRYGQPGGLGGPNEVLRGSSPNTGRVMPPGGLIGGTPVAEPGQPNSSAPSRRMNPVGGVIGGGGAGTSPTGAAGSRPGAGRASQLSGMHGLAPIGGSPSVGTSGGGPGRPGRCDRAGGEMRRWDPDHPWEVEEGVDPVVRPPAEKGPIDPGPAIGFDR